MQGGHKNKNSCVRGDVTALSATDVAPKNRIHKNTELQILNSSAGMDRRELIGGGGLVEVMTADRASSWK